MDCVSTVELDQRLELCCLTSDQDNQLVAIGSQQHITYLDVRCAKIVMSVRSQDDRWGVRSLSVANNITTIGGGYGRVSFFDFRNKSYMVCIFANACCYFRRASGCLFSAAYVLHA